MARNILVFLIVGVVYFLFCPISIADVPHMINYQGKLTTADGGCLNDMVQMTFSIYPDTLGSSADWTETQTEVVVKEGLFNVLLGSVDTIPASVFDGSTKYLGVQVESDPEMRPLKPIVSVAYAYRAGIADSGMGGWVDDGSVVRLEGDDDYVGVGTFYPAAKLDVVGDINVSSTYRIGEERILSIPGSRNLFVGEDAGDNYTDGSENTFVGFGAGFGNGSGSGNTCLGFGAGAANITGSYNVFIGRWAGALETESNKLYIANGEFDEDVLVYGDFSTRRLGIGTTSPDRPLHIHETSGPGICLKLSSYEEGSTTLEFDASANAHVVVGGNPSISITPYGYVGIGTTSPEGALDVNSTTGALIVPRMTTAQRDALAAVNGMIIYNTSTNQFNFYENDAWVTK